MDAINHHLHKPVMMGADTTYMCQGLFRTFLPDAIDAYLLIALPTAFLVTGGIGIVLERTVVRWLYGRPLETLLATSGIGLMLMQLVLTVLVTCRWIVTFKLGRVLQAVRDAESRLMFIGYDPLWCELGDPASAGTGRHGDPAVRTVL